jgi:glycosyltransferase involved in cell wall biosynthesis
METKKLKILKSPWHLAHDYDLMMALKDVADFDLLINYTRRWDTKIRPFPKNAKWVSHIEKGKYDLAILNIDQQCSNPRLNKSVLTQNMKQVIKEQEPDLPIVFINHGTPVYPETYPDTSAKEGYISKQLRYEILKIVGDDYMVVNSHQAQKDWRKGTAIIHGMDKDEWYFSDAKEPRVATFISVAGIGDRYYNRSFLAETIDYLKMKHGIYLQWINTPGCFKAKDIEDYKQYLSKTLIYFNPTYASPMPRSRTEAMLSGCCIITTRSHDAEEFIIEGHNGFFVPHDNYEYAGDLIAKLMKEKYQIAKQVGRNARETAIQKFSRERYRDDWINFLKSINVIKL